ncbi:EVE domain-containing protein [Pannus brasiliensis CCIBt3594]|uniref:EVE domain-containing protein n=1 Tax=Pannus brasiliensis CCIBt3594 TaxID=1427578 RepID=A0AAW9QPA2_9CHRO
MVYWLFQANPKYSQILEAIERLEEIYWLVTRYSKEIAPGDRVMIWIAGKRAGIYALAEVLEAPRFRDEPPDIDIWTMPVRAKARFWAPVRFQQKLLDTPLLKSVLVFDPILHELEVIRRPHNSNFRVSDEQWNRAISLLDGIDV